MYDLLDFQKLGFQRLFVFKNEPEQIYALFQSDWSTIQFKKILLITELLKLICKK